MTVCRTCNTEFDPDTVYATFRTDFHHRLGFAYSGRRPGFVANFCSEDCRYLDIDSRAKAQNAKMVGRRTAERDAVRREP